jgi:hypothetical protein
MVVLDPQAGSNSARPAPDAKANDRSDGAHNRMMGAWRSYATKANFVGS